MLLNKTEAAKLAGVARRTFYSHIESKGISVTFDELDGLEKVDLSELERVYGLEHIAANRQKLEEHKKSRAESAGLSHDNTHSRTQNVTPTHTEIRVREQAKDIEKLNAVLEIKESAHRQRIEDLELTIQEVQKKADSFQLLLENHNGEQTSQREWTESFKSLEARISNQEQATKAQKELAAKRLRQAKILKKKLDAEKSKSFWQKLFG